MPAPPPRRSDDGGRSRSSTSGRGAGGSTSRGATGGGAAKSNAAKGKRQGAQTGQPARSTSSRTGRGTGSYATGGGAGRGNRQTGATSSRGGRPGDDRGATDIPARRDLRGAAVDLPRWVVENLARVTPKHRVAAALEELGEATAAFTEGKYSRALRHGLKAKDLAPRDTTVREVLGLSAYRAGDWRVALRELRTYRRLTGETTHLPVEMDTLRAEGRADDVDKAWQQLQDLGGSPSALKEGKVVYGSHLLDIGRVAEARALVTPRSLSPKPHEEDLRVWYVAARAAALDRDAEAARRLRNAILQADPSFPGIDELESWIAAAG
ncbi:MAG TPA: hypothetical protein VGC11_06780 [Acidimicrobiia bacterium]